jgi:hypothetical protein
MGKTKERIKVNKIKDTFDADHRKDGASIKGGRCSHRAAIAILLALSILAFFAIPIIYPASWEDTSDNIPHPNGTTDTVRDFLDNFVCRYEPKPKEKDAPNNTVIDIPGYCHPKLQSVPYNRTQIVSSSQLPKTSVSFFQLLKHTIHWWTNVLLHPTTNTIEGGDLILILPRPLQIWDLDALRDPFIQHYFLGLSRYNNNNNNDSATPMLKKVARHKETFNPLDSGAYLAVYLLRLQGLQTRNDMMENTCLPETTEECVVSNNENHPSRDDTIIRWNDTNQLSSTINRLGDYLNILPTYNDRIPSNTNNIHEHPLTWNKTLLESLFPKYTHTYNLISSYQTMIRSEYEALTLSSPEEFGGNVNYAQYAGMRINVLSRAFGVMISDTDIGSTYTTAGNNTRQLSEEIQSYKTSNFGDYASHHDPSALTYAFRSMCPLLDMYNSHPNPNVRWKYDSSTSSYVVHARRGIPSGDEIIVSYGKYTEGHLFAKYGYVNGDGSSKTEVGLNVFHRILGDVGLSWQFSLLSFQQLWTRQMYDDATVVLGDHRDGEATQLSLDMQSQELLRYLMFDDGHVECIHFDNDDDSLSRHQELKLLKLRHMKRLANIGDAWTIRLPARFPNAQPYQGDTFSKMEQHGQESRVGIDAKRILSTCRLLSLTVDDVGGDALTYLKDGLENGHYNTASSKQSYFQVEKHEIGLEYRALMCVVRLSDVAFRRYGKYAQPNGNNEPQRTNGREWMAWYIRDGEMRLLSILRRTALNEANKLRIRLQSTNENVHVREKPCPIESSLPMLKLIDAF